MLLTSVFNLEEEVWEGISMWMMVAEWHPTPVLLPGKPHGWRSLVGCRPWGRTESGTTWATSLSLFTFMHWRRKWQLTPVFLPGESQGQRSLVGCHLWGHTESDTTEATWQQQQQPACVTRKSFRNLCWKNFRIINKYTKRTTIKI